MGTPNHDGEWIDMSGIPEDARFEEPELSCMLENLQKDRKGSSKGFWRGKKGWSKGESRGGLKLSTKEAGKGGRPENYKQHRLKLQGVVSTEAGEISRLMERAELGHFAKDCNQNKEPTQIQRLSSVVRFATTPAPFILDTIFVLITPVTNLVLVFFETNAVLTLILETGCVLKVTVKEMTKLSSVFEKMMFPFLVRAQASAQAQSLSLAT